MSDYSLHGSSDETFCIVTITLTFLGLFRLRFVSSREGRNSICTALSSVAIHTRTATAAAHVQSPLMNWILSLVVNMQDLLTSSYT